MSSDQIMHERWIIHHDADAFAELVSRYANMVYATSRRVMQNSADAEDVAQDCFIELARRKTVITPSLGSWLHKATVHHCLDRIKSEQRRRAREGKYVAERPACHEPKWDDIEPHIDAAIAALPEDLQAVLIRRFFEARTHQAIADQLGIPRSTVQYRIEKGLDRIRHALKRGGLMLGGPALTALMIAGGKTAEAAPLSLIAAIGKRAIAEHASSRAPATVATLSSRVSFISIMRKKSVAPLLAVIACALAYFALRPGSQTSDSAIQSSTPIQTASESIPTQFSSIDTVPVALSPIIIDDSSEHGSASGRVYAKSTGVGLAGMIVSATSIKQKGADQRSKHNARTDEEGYYRFDTLSPAQYRFRIDWQVSSEKSPSIVERIVFVKPGEDTVSIDFPVLRGLLITGQVINYDGEPVLHTKVDLWGLTYPDFRANTESDDEGMFRFAGIPFMSKIVLSAIGSRRITLNPYDADLTDIKIIAGEYGSITGTVVDQEGRFVPGAVVLPVGTDGIFSPIITANDKGNFEAERLPADTYAVSAYPPGSVSFRDLSPIELTVEPGQQISDLRLLCEETSQEAGTRSLVGRILDRNGGPITDAQLFISIGPSMGRTQTNRQGNYTFSSLLDGEYLIEVRAKGYRNVTKSVFLTRNETVDFVVQERGVVKGQVLDARTGNPIQEFSVLCTPYEITSLYAQGLQFESQTDAEGRFTVNPDADSATIIVRAQGYAPNSVFLPEIPKNKPVTDVVIRLTPGAQVNGIVLAPDGEAVPNAMIFMDEVQAPQYALTLSDEKGQFSLNMQPEGNVMVCAFHPRYSSGQAVIKTTANQTHTITINLQKGGTVSGAVLLDGELLYNHHRHSIRIEYTDENAFTAQTESGAQGSFQLKNVPPGIANVRAFSDSPCVRSLYVPVEIQSGHVTEVNMDFAPLTASVEGQVHDAFGTVITTGKLELTVDTRTGREVISNVFIRFDGSFSFDYAPSGTATLEVIVPGYTPKNITLLINDGSHNVQDIEIAER